MRRTISGWTAPWGVSAALALLLVGPAGCNLSLPGSNNPGGGSSNGSGNPAPGGSSQSPDTGGSNGTTTEPPAGQPLIVAVNILGLGNVQQAPNGPSVTLTAVPADGWEFARWDGADVPNQPQITVNVGEVPAITAVFVMAGAGGDTADLDGDGVANDDDNCMAVANPEQVDTDGDGAGDACDVCAGFDDAADADADGAADGCDPCPNDADNDADADGVCGDVDNCPQEANAGQADADQDGLGDACDSCPSDAENDSDRDGVCGDVDRCPDTAQRVVVDEEGCAVSPDEPPANNPSPDCGNGVIDAGEDCDDGGESATCDSDCTSPACGDGVVNVTAGEQCDDSNQLPGDGCDAACQNERPANDDCANAITVLAGVTEFSNDFATTDGPDEPGLCDFFGSTQIQADVWFRYQATCTDNATISLCGSEYDTKMAVYDDVGVCPSNAAALRCSDDDCGAGTSDARVTVPVVTNQFYLIRAGGFEGATGRGTLTIRCGGSACSGGAGDCLANNGADSPGCDNATTGSATCCQDVCAVDAFCCDVTWDQFCADEAGGLCNPAGFTSCAPGAGDCTQGNGSPGCDDAGCCDTVCTADPFCCVDTWDAICADEAGACGLGCGTATGSCFTGDDTRPPGCSIDTCCQAVCAQDAFCCATAWDQSCADRATQIRTDPDPTVAAQCQ